MNRNGVGGLSVATVLTLIIALHVFARGRSMTRWMSRVLMLFYTGLLVIVASYRLVSIEWRLLLLDHWIAWY